LKVIEDYLEIEEDAFKLIKHKKKAEDKKKLEAQAELNANGGTEENSKSKINIRNSQTNRNKNTCFDPREVINKERNLYEHFKVNKQIIFR